MREKTLFETIVYEYGSVPKVQKAMGYKSRMAVYQWKTRGIPPSKILQIHKDTGIDIRVLLEGAEKPTEAIVS